MRRKLRVESTYDFEGGGVPANQAGGVTGENYSMPPPDLAIRSQKLGVTSFAETDLRAKARFSGSFGAQLW